MYPSTQVDNASICSSDPLALHAPTLLPFQKYLLLHPTLLDIDKEIQKCTASETQRKQEVKRTTVVPRIINNRTTHKRSDKRTRLPHNAEQREEQELLAARRHLADHRLAVAVPRTHEQAIESLIHPDFPALMEAERLRPDADHAPAVEDDDAHCDDHEHGFGREAVVFLDAPEGADADCLRGDADNEEVRELETVVCYDFVLEGPDDGHGGVQAVPEEKVAREIREALAKVPDLLDGVFELLQAGEDDVGVAWVLAWTTLLEHEPGNGTENPDAGGEGDEDGETPVVVGFAFVDFETEHDADDYCEDEDLEDGLGVERRIRELVSLHHVREVVLSSGDATLRVLLSFCSQLFGVPCQAREGCRPKCDCKMTSVMFQVVHT